MRKVMVIAASFLPASCFTANVQNGESLPPEVNGTIPELTYDNKVAYYDARANQTKELEITRSETATKGSGLSMLPDGGGGGKSNIVLQGGTSPAVLSRDAKLLVKLADEGSDPNGWVMLYRLEQT